MTTQKNMIAIEVYKDEYKQQVIDLILDIQQNEFQVPITINDQPDLLDVIFFIVKIKAIFGWQKTGMKLLKL